MNTKFLTIFLTVFAYFPLVGSTVHAAPDIDTARLEGLDWRMIGPWCGGRVTTVTGVPGKPRLYYMGATGGGVWKTENAGTTWENISDGNFKVGTIGAVAVAESDHNVIYVGTGESPIRGVTTSHGDGVWKSSDGGKNWEHLGLEASGQISRIKIHPRNPDIAYIAVQGQIWGPNEERGIYRTINGGKSFEQVLKANENTGASDLAMDPVNPRVLYAAMWNHGRKPWFIHSGGPGGGIYKSNDGGATVTFDGGETWSSIVNQPTAQFYRVATDNQVPFRIYGGQQDNSTVSIASRSLYGGIGVADYHAVGGGESAHIVFDPDDPRLVYATSINGTLTEYDHETGLQRSIIPYPELVYGKDSRDLRYRTNWNAPLAISPHDPAVVYYGTQYVLKSEDRGLNWTEISPDLTRNDAEKQGRNGGPLTPENVGAEFYNTVFYIVESALEQGHIWVGSDDGLVHLSRDGGDNWVNISPPHKGKAGAEAMINAIEISPHQAGTAYLAVTGYKLNDFSPYIYRTSDYGKRWTRIDRGLPEDTFVRVVRADPAREGLLYAGTEAGMFVSFNEGGDWQPLQLNLPPVPITDLSIRQDSLAAATQGRGF